MLIPNFVSRRVRVKKIDSFYIPEIENKQFYSSFLEKEVKRIVSTFPKDIEILVLIGAGLLPIVDYLVDFLNLKLILYFESLWNFEVFQKRFSLITNNSLIKTIKHYEELKYHLQKFPKAIVFLHPSYKRFFPFLTESIFAFLRNDTHSKTISKFQYYWQVHYAKNLQQKEILFLDTTLIKKEKILFIGSGFTLDEDLKNIDFDEFFIVASDSALVPALYRKIPVDMVISLDPQVGTLYHFYHYKEKFKKIFLLTWLGGRPEIRNFFQETFYFLTTFPFDQVIKDYEADIVALSNPERDALGYIKELSFELGKTILPIGCGLPSNQKMYYTPNTGYDYFGLLKENRIQTNLHYHYELYQNQSYKRINFDKKAISSDQPQKKFPRKTLSSQQIIAYLHQKKSALLSNYPFLKTFYYLLED
ncbi:MAG: hypothetical protein NZ853_10560 [Leptospiraceae bacterium]|nr:hypothetical protein [Leptospiraceae bacterium]MDW7977106.1 hypothetical protein [Leptospiraceae bacterium]